MTPTSHPREHDEGPWYKQFWAWFVFTPLIVVVIACSITVTIAFKTKEDVVVDDYYKVGKMINQSFVPEQRARELGIVADLIFDSETGEVIAEVEGTEDESLVLSFSHPVNADLDQYVTLKHITGTRYRADASLPENGRWYLRLSEISDAGEEVWRLQGEAQMQYPQSVLTLR